MADLKHLAILQAAITQKDVTIWNNWLVQQRQINPNFAPDLTEAHLSGAMLASADLSGTNLRDARLSSAHLGGADLGGANLRGANLTSTNLNGANLSSADLRGANLTRANLFNANLTEASIARTAFASVDLSSTHGLKSVHHFGPSTIGIDTIYRSKGIIPEAFLRGAGFQSNMIAFAKSLVGNSIEYYSAFISYSDKDKLFATRLHGDLQLNDVRVWFAPEDLKIGDPLKQTIDESIKLYDKLILVLSENSIHRAWVHHEVSRALEKEKQHNKVVLFPIRLDDTVFTTTAQWAYDIQQRHIGDFTNWTNPLLYQNAINRLLRDLNAKS